MIAEPPDAVARASELVAIFYPQRESFASLAGATADELPDGPRTLLDHTSHMTLAMERFHGGPVSLEVRNRKESIDGRYAREILLAAPDGRIVQYGIVRIDLARLPRDTAAAIRSEQQPLGRILIAAGFLCDVHDVALLRIATGAALASATGTQIGMETFGRVASISLDGRPLIELLEVVAPGTA